PAPASPVTHTLSLHDALPIYAGEVIAAVVAESRALAEDACDAIHVEYDVLPVVASAAAALAPVATLVYEEFGDNIAAHIVQRVGDRKITRLNSSHQIISYAVF